MIIQLKEYQDKAVDKLIREVCELLEGAGSRKVCVFQAPTGSGKTVMTAKFIEGLINERLEDDLCFLWMSIGKGDLHVQSKRSLERIFSGFPRVGLVEDEFSGGRDIIGRNEVVVANWEKLWRQDDQGEFKAILMRDGEKINFREVLARTREQRQIILVIDESHFGSDAERTNQLREEIAADLTLEMSATPFLATGIYRLVQIEPKHVIEEGMIKKEVIINEGLDKLTDDEIDSQTAILEVAFAKRTKLQSLFKEEGVLINPLVLIQLPTGEAGKEKQKAVEEFLAGKGVTEENSRLAIWLAEQKSEDLELISQPQNKVEFLVFKQAVDTGWDCPRAHILVKFRETRSVVFEIQTVGRILRMPELKHYVNEELNRGYVFTNVGDIEVGQKEYNAHIIKHLKAQRKSCYDGTGLVSYFRQRSDYGDITASFDPVLEKEACAYLGIKEEEVFEKNIKIAQKKGLKIDLDQFRHEIQSNVPVEVERIDSLEGRLEGGEVQVLTMALNDQQAVFNELIKGELGTFRNIKRSVPKVKMALYVWCQRYLGSDQWDGGVAVVQRVFLQASNQKILKAILSRAIEAYKEIKTAEVVAREEKSEQFYDFDAPKEDFFNENMDVPVAHQKYLFEPCYLRKDRSEPEKNFEAFLKSHEDEIIWWWKNGEGRKDYFGIRYVHPDGRVRTFYPDYLVHLKDGRLGIFETKHHLDQDGAGPTKAKVDALREYLQKTVKAGPCVFGGVVIERHHQFWIHDAQRYDWGCAQKGDWTDWVLLEL